MNHPSPGALPGSYAESLYTLNGTREISQLPVNGEVGLMKPTKAYATIDRLPPELLSKVFLVCAAPEHDDFTCGDHLPWIAIAQVCVYWRSVALACGELWRWLIFSNPEATKEMVRRSNGVTLIVKAFDGFRGHIIYENVRMVISDMRRVSVLHLRFPLHRLYTLLQELSTAAPKLQSLRLSTDNPSSRAFILGRPFETLNVIFSDHMPSLRRLQLINYKLSWQALPLPLSGLTHLELRNAGTPPTSAQFLSFLRGVPMLNTLILHGAIPTDPLKPIIVSPRQLLPNLQVFTLGGSVEACTSLLQYLAYPRSAIASFVCDIPSNVNPDIYRFLQEARSAVTHEGGDHVIRGLALEARVDYFVLRCSAAHCCSPFILTEEMPQLTVTLRQNHPLPIIELIHATITTLPLAEVQTLKLDAQVVWLQGVDWSGFLQRLPEIHTIHLKCSFPDKLLKVLTDSGEKMGGSAKPVTLILPQLRSLWLTSVNIGNWGCMSQSLLAFLRACVQGGSTIQLLRLLRCWSLNGKDVEMMKEFVHDVEWVKPEIYCSDGTSDSGSDSDII